MTDMAIDRLLPSNSLVHRLSSPLAASGCLSSPLSGINFNDGFGGGNEVSENVIFNQCRQSGDHGTPRALQPRSTAKTSACMPLPAPLSLECHRLSRGSS